MSEDPIQAIVDKLDAIEKSVSSPAVKSQETPPTPIVCDPVAIKEAAHRGASNAAARIAENVDRINLVAHNLEMALAPAQAAVRAAQERPTWHILAVILVVLCGLASAFVSGVVVTRTGVLFSTQVGCNYLGGNWSERADSGGFVCWR